MCIVIVKNRNVLEPDYNTLKNCFLNNKDGAGFAFERRGQVNIVKGLMSFDEFWKVYKSYGLTKNNAIIYHFRIATEGSVDKGNCHPFPLTTNINQLKKTKVKSDFALVHNGMLFTKDEKEFDLSDTMQFTRMLANFKTPVLSNALLDIIDLVASESGSKFAILEKSGQIRKFGKFLKDKGLYFSNETYKDIYLPIVNVNTTYGRNTKFKYTDWPSPSTTIQTPMPDYFCITCQAEFTEEQASNDFYRCYQCGVPLEDLNIYYNENCS